MILDCGPSYAVRRAAKAARREEHESQWHPFFAIWPRRLHNKCVWFHWIRRKKRHCIAYYGDDYYITEYRMNINDEMKYAEVE